MRRCLYIKLLIDILMITLLLPDYFIQLHDIIHVSPVLTGTSRSVSSLNMACEQNRLHWSGTRPATNKRYVFLFALSTAAVMPTRKPADVLNMLLHAGFCLNRGSFQTPSEVSVAARASSRHSVPASATNLSGKERAPRFSANGPAPCTMGISLSL